MYEASIVTMIVTQCQLRNLLTSVTIVVIVGDSANISMFIKKTQINPEFFNFSVDQGWDYFRDQSLVCQDISAVSFFVNNTTDISVLITIPHTFLYLSQFSVIP